MAHASWALMMALQLAGAPALAANVDEATATVPESAEEGVDEDMAAQDRRPDRHRRASRSKRAVRGQPHPGPATRSRPATASRPGPRRAARPPTRPGVRHPAPPPPRRTYRRVTPAHGVLVYGPPPRHHQHYPATSAGRVDVQQSHLPNRSVDRANTFALGIKAGSFLSGTESGQIYSDPGLGLLARYRPSEAVGLQFDLMHHAGAFSDRRQTQAAGSLALFAYPWTRVSPYVIGGVTWNNRSLLETRASEGGAVTVASQDVLTGLHGGLGVQLGLGSNVGLEFEGRYIGYLARGGQDPIGALQGTGGLVFHF